MFWSLFAVQLVTWNVRMRLRMRDIYNNIVSEVTNLYSVKKAKIAGFEIALQPLCFAELHRLQRDNITLLIIKSCLLPTDSTLIQIFGGRDSSWEDSAQLRSKVESFWEIICFSKQPTLLWLQGYTRISFYQTSSQNVSHLFLSEWRVHSVVNWQPVFFE